MSNHKKIFSTQFIVNLKEDLRLLLPQILK